MGITLPVLSASGKTHCWNERFLKNARGCTWFLIILTGMLHGPKLLLWLSLFIMLSISVSLTVLIKNKFKTFFLGTYQKAFSHLVF